MDNTITIEKEVSNLYIPKDVEYLSPDIVSQVRLGLQGYPGTGKTYSCFTFPNPVILNLDNKLGVHVEKITIPIVNLWNPKCPFIKPNEPREEAVLRWLLTVGPLLKKEQTLILDSWTTLQNWFDIRVTNIDHYSDKGKLDPYKPWRLKGNFAGAVCDALKSLPCNSVTTFHDSPERDDEGKIVGVKPTMTGSFADQLAGHFTDWFHQLVMNKKSADKTTDLMVDGKVVPEYVWQVRSDSKRKCLTSKIIPTNLMFVPANYNYFTAKFQ